MLSVPFQLITHIYEVFARYDYTGKDFCGFCYTPDEIEYIMHTPINLIDLNHGRKLLWESADHWENADVYRHYLPRLLELMGPPWFLDDMYPLHLLEVLLGLGFHKWPDPERQGVIDYLESQKPMFKQQFTKEDFEEWATGFFAVRSNTGEQARIKQTPETLSAGIAGLEGEVYGVTTPTDLIEMVGKVLDAGDIFVSFENYDENIYFRLQLDDIEVLD
jgi:hypothetical protein